MPTRVLLAALGSWGDIFPLLGVAHSLRGKGAEPVFATAPAFADLVQGEGFEARPIGPDISVDDVIAHPEILDHRLAGALSVKRMFDVFLRPYLDQTFTDLCDATSGMDVLAAHPSVLPAPLVSERTGIPRVTVTIAPGLIPSMYTVPPANPLPAMPGPVGRVLNAAAWTSSRVVLRAMFDRALNGVRSANGLPRSSDAFMSAALSKRGVVVLSSERYTPRQPDWSSSVDLVGFVTWDRPASLLQEQPALDIAAAESPRVLVTGGASTSLDPQRFFELAAEALDAVGLEGLYLVGFEKNITGPLLRRKNVVPFAPLSDVLPHVAAAIHHGGIGTTAAVLRSGIPAVVVPRAFDQFFHAGRVEALGVGTRLSWPRLSKRHLERAIAKVVNDASIRERAALLGAALASEGDGSDRAAEALLSRAGR